ncbi:SH3 domain-binding protein 1 [Xenopus laevis]|uniref:SH3 domain-binding protein 1 n=2 Tax=Xenopus laevis TaxID=8355 RepID=A0A974HPX6_XENLA|nr:SH3 domain-binding protein 1 [Xenopus laevis]OCT85546.1 hypothetical protein XELAEV_18023715mg [Xenopus laevis]
MIQRQLHRMRQLANHGPGRSQDVTDILTEDLLLADQQVEPVKKLAHLVGKRLISCLQAPAGSDREKKLRKLALSSLSWTMAECLKEIDTESRMRRTLEMGCCVEGILSQDLADFEISLEKEVLQPLTKLSEEDLPTVLKHRKQLQKLITDWNSAKSRLSQTQKNINAGQGGGSTGTAAKLESLKEEEEELRRKLEQSKDEYIADLYNYTTKEKECERYVIQLLELQAEYHKKSLSHLTEALEELKDLQNETVQDSIEQPSAEVYGAPLETHLAKFECEIAVPISACVRMLLSRGMQEEGLFRLTAGASILRKLKACLGAGASDLSNFMSEPHAVAGALKSYLRELPEPLMTYELFDDWMTAGSTKDPEKRLECYRQLCKKLPPANYNNLRYLIKFMAKLAEHQEVNKMTPSNIAIVLGPNLLWAKSDGETSLWDMASASPIMMVSVVEGLLNCAASLFPEDVDFGVSEAYPDTSSVLPIKNQDCPKAEETTPPPSNVYENTESVSECLTEWEEQTKLASQKALPPIDENNSTTTKVEGSPTTMRKVKRQAPQRPNIPPPIQPQTNPSTEAAESYNSPKPIPRRSMSGSLKVPNKPPPHPPLPLQIAKSAVEGDNESPTKSPPPRPLPRNRIQSTEN